MNTIYKTSAVTVLALLVLPSISCRNEGRRTIGSDCEQDSDCQSSRCDELVCKSSNPVPIDEGCDHSLDCLSERCVVVNGKGVCKDGERTEGQRCTHPSQCTSGACVQSRCGGHASDGGVDMADPQDAAPADSAAHDDIRTDLAFSDGAADSFAPGEPRLVWVANFGGSQQEQANGIAIGPGGDIFLAGGFSGSFGLGGRQLFLWGTNDLFMARFDEKGAHRWSKNYGKYDEYALAFGLAFDPAAGALTIAGHFSGTQSFGGGNFVATGDGDWLIASYDLDGDYRWSRSVTGGEYDTAAAVTADAQGNVTAVGYFWDTVNAGGVDISSKGGADALIAHYDRDGRHLWSAGYGAAGNDTLRGVVADSAGNIYVAGLLTGSVSYGGSALPHQGDLDALVASFDESGAHRWSIAFGGVGKDWASELAVSSDGLLAVCGEFSGAMQVGAQSLASAGGSDGFLVALDARTGAHRWAKALGGTGDDLCRSVVIDDTGRITVTGSFEKGVDFGRGELVSAGKVDVFLAGYDELGDHLWSQRFGGTSSDQGDELAVRPNGNIVTTGTFWGMVDFGNGPVWAVLSDLYVMELAPPPR